MLLSRAGVMRNKSAVAHGMGFFFKLYQLSVPLGPSFPVGVIKLFSIPIPKKSDRG